MQTLTRELWQKQDQHRGDRRRLFTCVADSIDVSTVLYAGSFVDLAPSFVWHSVSYVDVDERANRFFADVDGIDELIAEHGVDPTDSDVRFLHADYTEDLEVDDNSVDLLISLYAGIATEYCTRYVRPQGYVLVNGSHGDAAMANLNPSLTLHGVVHASNDDYLFRDDALDTYFVPKRSGEVVTAESLRAGLRGIAYTKSPFAYLFRRGPALSGR